MPDNGSGPFYYSINYPLVSVIVINTEESYYKGSTQYNWLEGQLKAINHSTHWIVICGHRPMYSSIATDYLQRHAASLRKSLEHLFFQYHVGIYREENQLSVLTNKDIAFWGHIHNYERSCPVYNGTCVGDYNDPNGTIYVVCGKVDSFFTIMMSLFRCRRT